MGPVTATILTIASLGLGIFSTFEGMAASSRAERLSKELTAQSMADSQRATADMYARADEAERKAAVNRAGAVYGTSRRAR